MKTRLEDRFIVGILADLSNPERGADVGRRIAEQGRTLDWHYLIRRMSDEGVLFLFFYCLKQFHLQDLLPPNVFDVLSGRYYENLRKNMMASAALKPVFDALNEQAVPFIVLKGIALAERVYPGFGIRGMSDADLLVKKDDMYRVDASLSSLGYVARDSSVKQALDNPAGYLASLDYRKDDGSLPNLHIHWHPVNTSVPAFMFAGQVDQERLWEMAIPVTVANAKARILCPEHQVIYLCEHALRINHSFDRLILMYDIFFVVKAHQDEVNWDFVADEARRFNVSKLVFLSLSIVRQYTSLTLSEEMMQRLHAAYLTFGEKLFLDLQFKNHRFRGGSILIYLAMNRGFVEKCRFLFRTVFPPPHILMQRRYAKDRAFRLSFYGERLWEVLSHPFRINRRDS
ncbi:MAG: nucleotidyltransferase family protein [Deltaproteobacteria bacterium]|nr:nucleotidyltransferase family protein [Deltaproteobacteria bacterium]